MIDTAAAEAPQEIAKTLDAVNFELPYIPDFLLEQTLLWFVPSRDKAAGAYLELSGSDAKDWSSYYTKKGWNFVHAESRQADGPYRAAKGGLHLRVLEPGKIFAPKPV